MRKKTKIPTILGIVILLVGTFAGVFFLNMNQVFKIGAASDSAPKDIRVSDIGDNSGTISWTTDKESSNFLIWGESQNKLNGIEKESDSDEKFFTHSITLTGLKPLTTYYYKINSDGVTHDNQGIPWQLTTGPSLGSSSDSITVSGSVLSSSGEPASRAIVYLTLNGYLMSTLSSQIGNFVFQLGSARTPDLQSFATIDESSTILEISVQAGPGGVASASILPQSAKPIPPLILGQVYDFRNLPESGDGQNPNANPGLPGDTESKSKFNIPASSEDTTQTSVILENLDEGETVTSTQPEFFGKGPAGEEITITVHSETPITGTVSIPSNGSWNWSPPENLSAGAHTVTILWKDVSGITRSLTRNFVVQAGEAPAFVASNSGQTTEPFPTDSPKPTVKAGTPTPIATIKPIPETGDLTPTILFTILGIGVIALSFVINKHAQSI